MKGARRKERGGGEWERKERGVEWAAVNKRLAIATHRPAALDYTSSMGVLALEAPQRTSVFWRL